MDLRLNGYRLRLKSRKPNLITAKKLLLENIERNKKWLEDYMADSPDEQNVVTNPTFKQPRFDRPRQIWVTLICIKALRLAVKDVIT